MFKNFIDRIKDILSKPIFYMSGGGNFFSSTNMKNEQRFYGITMRAIDTTASNIAATEFTLVKMSTNGKDKTPATNHPSYKLLQRPNDFFTNNDLMYLTASNIMSSGIAYWYLVRNGNGDPIELWPMPPERMIMKRGKNFIDGYSFMNWAGNKIDFNVNEIIPIYRPNPFNWWKGISLIDGAKYEIDADLNSIVWNANFFKNGAVPSGSLQIDTPLDKDKVEIVRQSIREFYSGKDNAHKIMVLGKGQTYNQLGPKQKEMDFIEQRRFSRDNTLSILNTPKSVVGITEDVNRANAEVSDYVFAKRNILPLLTLIFEKINTFYLPMFKNTDGLVFEFENPVPDDKTQELAEDQAAVNNWLTINEIRSKRGYEPVDGGDVLYMPMTLYPMATDTDPSNPPVEDSWNVKGFKKNDRTYLIQKRRVITTYQNLMDKKLRQSFSLLVKDIKKGKIEKVYKTKGSEQFITFLKPILDNWQTLTAKLIFDFGHQVGEEAVNLNNDIYNIPKVDMSSILPMLKHRADTTADSITSSILDRAREVIARNLEDGEFDPSKIVDDIANTIDDETDFRSERIMRTEVSYSFNSSAMADYEASGFVEKIKWIVGDAPCPVCQQNDNEIVDLGDSFTSGDTEPPSHPNCECDVVPVFE